MFLGRKLGDTRGLKTKSRTLCHVENPLLYENKILQISIENGPDGDPKEQKAKTATWPLPPALNRLHQSSHSGPEVRSDMNPQACGAGQG